MGCAKGEAKEPPLRPVFDRRIKLEFHGARITSDGGLLAYRELDDALGLTAIAVSKLLDGRRGRNTRHKLSGLFRQSVFGRLAGYEDVNDAERLARDPTMRAIVGREGLDRLAASSSQIGRFETEWLASDVNLETLADLPGAWIDQVKRYNSATGAFIDVFASTNIVGPLGITVHQGVLYVTNSNPPEGVQRFDAATGMNTGNFVPSLSQPQSAKDVKVNPANNRLYVLYYNKATVETFDLTTMASFGLLMPAGNPIGSGGLYTAIGMAFGPDGNLYISGGTFGGNFGVRRYNPTTGAFIDFFAKMERSRASQAESRLVPIATFTSPLPPVAVPM